MNGFISSQPHRCRYSLCLLCPVSLPLPLLSITIFSSPLYKAVWKPNILSPLWLTSFHFFPHSDFIWRGEPHTNKELPFERHGDTQNCLLTFAFDKKKEKNKKHLAICSPAAAGLFPSHENIYLLEWKFLVSRCASSLLQFCVQICYLSLQIQFKCQICPSAPAHRCTNNLQQLS